MRAVRWQAPWILLLGVAGSQAGHLLVYSLRYGARATDLQSAGAHGYFVPVAAGALTAAGAALAVAVALIGLARLGASGTPGVRVSGPPVMDLLAVLFTLQLALFVAQEALESLAAGVPLEAVVLVWGVAAQLPFALLGAAALSLVCGRFETALADLTRARARSLDRCRLAPPPGVPLITAERFMPAARGRGLASRGPPPQFR